MRFFYRCFTTSRVNSPLFLNGFSHIKMFSTTSNLGMDNNNNNNHPPLSPGISCDIEVHVREYYEDEATKFKAPNDEHLTQKKYKSAEEVQQAYGSFIDEKNQEASEAAQVEKRKCVNQITDEMEEEYYTRDPAPIRQGVQEETDRRFREPSEGSQPEGDKLPGQVEWNNEMWEKANAQPIHEGESSSDSESTGEEHEPSTDPESPGNMDTEPQGDMNSEPQGDMNPEPQGDVNPESQGDMNPTEEQKPEGDADSSNKRSRSEEPSEDSDSKKVKTEDKQSPLDYVIGKESTEMPDIFTSDGGD